MMTIERMDDCFEMAMSRMIMFCGNKTLMQIDIAAVDAIRNGVKPATIAAVASALNNEIKSSSPRRSERIKIIMSGGFITRLKMEAQGLINKENGLLRA
jgi:chromate transport protein ChrA